MIIREILCPALAYANSFSLPKYFLVRMIVNHRKC